MFRPEVHSFEILRHVDDDQVGWETPKASDDDRFRVLNHDYENLRRRTWREAEQVISIESDLIAAFNEAKRKGDPVSEGDLIDWEDCEAAYALFNLDVGVASSVVALSAARCVPFTSCNGGAFGDSHHEQHPLVAFLATRRELPLLLECAEVASVGLAANDYGLLLYAKDIDAMRLFARTLIDRGKGWRPKSPRPKPIMKDRLPPARDLCDWPEQGLSTSAGGGAPDLD